MRFGTLHVIKADGRLGSEYPIMSNVVFGSDDSVEIKLKVDDVSERQCQIVPEAATRTLHLEVLDAVHATSVDGQRLKSGERKKLEDGDIVAVGNRRFKIMYHKSNRDAKTRTPGRSGATPGTQSSQKKRKSIFDSTPPVECKTPATPQKEARGDQVTSTSVFTTGTPATPPKQPRTSPRQPKSILSAKKNILVTRTPTMSPKVVRWGSPKYKSPTSPGTTKPAKPARKSTPAILPRSPITATRKRSFGTLDEKIKRLAALPARRRSSTGPGVKPDTSIVDEVPETPETSLIVSNDLSAVTEAPKQESAEPVANGRRSSNVSSISEKQRSLARASTGSSSSRKSEPIKPSPIATPSSSKRMSTSNLSTASTSSSSSRKSRVSQSFRVSPITTPKPAGVARLSTKSPGASSNRSSISSTSSRKSRQSFRTSPSLSGADVLSSTMAGSPNVCIADQPTDSFGSLSVSEADLSMFDGTLMNDGADNSTLKERRSSGSSSKRRSRVSRSPKAESLMEVDEAEAAEKEESAPPMQKVSEEPEADTNCDEGVAPVATSSSRRSSRLSGASSFKDAEDVGPGNKTGVAMPSSTNQENRAPVKKTWAGVLKRSIASGSPFKVNHRRSLKLKTKVKSSVARALRHNLRKTTESEIVAAFSTTGHALSPQTIYINKKLDAANLTTKTTPKRNSSLLNKTHDIDLEMFVSPFNTPDNSEALERARDFVKRLPSSRRSTANNTSSLSVSSAESPKPNTSRRSTRSSTTSEAEVVGDEVVGSAERPAEESTIGIADNLMEAGTETDSENVAQAEDAVEAEPAASSASSRSSARRSTATNFQGVKNLLATPKDVRSPENNLDCDLKGVKKMLATPNVPRSPENNLEKDVGGVKKMFATPKEAASPKNELDGSFRGVKKLLQTPKQVPSPKNELDGNFSGVKKLLRTPKDIVSPKNELDANFSGVKRLLRTPKDVKSPENNLDCDYRGTKRLFKTPEASEKQHGRGLNDSALEGVPELLSEATPKRKPSSPAESKAKRRKSALPTAENGEPSEVAAPNEELAEVLQEEEVKTRSPMARSRSKRGEKIELVEPEKDSEELETSKAAKPKSTKAAPKSKPTTSTRGRTTRRRAKKDDQSTDDEDNVPPVEENHSEPATDSQNSDEGQQLKTETKTRVARRKKVEFAELPAMKTPTTTTRRARRAKASPVKSSDADDSRASGADSQPSEPDSQPSEAESHPAEAEPQHSSGKATRGSRRVPKRKLEENASQVEEPETAEVKTPSKSAGRGRKAKTAEIVTEQVPETPVESSTKGRRRAAKPKATPKAKKMEDDKQVEPVSKDQEAEKETTTSTKRGGRKVAQRAESVDVEQAPKQTKRTRVVKAAKNKKSEPEEPETEPETAPEPEVAEPKSRSRKRKVLPTESPVKKTDSKKRAKKAESEQAPLPTPSTRTMRTRRR